MLIIARSIKFGASNDVTLPLCNLWKPEKSMPCGAEDFPGP